MTTQSPVLREFTDAARRHFSFLISDFGFSEAELPNDKDINEFQVCYLSARVLVTIEGINWGYGIQILLSVCEPSANKVRPEIPLWPIVKLRQPDLYKSLMVADGQLAQLEVYATALRLCASDILGGDFTISAAAEKLISEEASIALGLEEQRRYDAESARASDAFHRKDYAEFIRLIEPFTNRLSESQKKNLDYARRQIA